MSVVIRDPKGLTKLWKVNPARPAALFNKVSSMILPIEVKGQRLLMAPGKKGVWIFWSVFECSRNNVCFPFWLYASPNWCFCNKHRTLLEANNVLTYKLILFRFTWFGGFFKFLCAGTSKRNKPQACFVSSVWCEESKAAADNHSSFYAPILTVNYIFISTSIILCNLQIKALSANLSLAYTFEH